MTLTTLKKPPIFWFNIFFDNQYFQEETFIDLEVKCFSKGFIIERKKKKCYLKLTGNQTTSKTPECNPHFKKFFSYKSGSVTNEPFPLRSYQVGKDLLYLYLRNANDLTETDNFVRLI